MTKTIGYAAKHSVSALRPMFIDRREPGASDVVIDVMFCGVCHSDVHQVKNEWKNTVYPCMPGHEIVGRVTAVGASVKKFGAGDLVGVGCMVDSCRECRSCKEGLEQYCERGFLATYNGNARNPSEENLTFGGYSESIVVREDFVLRIPSGMSLASAAPLMCAGLTTFSPMRYWKVGPGTSLAVVGLGGLGHMAVKLARALGADVTVISTSPDKKEAARILGAKKLIVSTEKKEMEEAESSFDFILSTIPQPHDVNIYMPLLKRDGILTIVGCIAPLTKPLDISGMIMDRRVLATSLIGGVAETQEVLDFAAKNGISADVKVIPIDEVNDAFKTVDEGEVPYRFVIDMASIKGKTEDDSLMAKVGL
ncbi:MAG: NAD(P)-dependent alcohol dehydrogenase [Gemmatimonadaceae bacterium]